MELEHMESHQIHRIVDSSSTQQQEQLGIQFHQISWVSEPTVAPDTGCGEGGTRSEQTSICTYEFCTQEHEALKQQLWAMLLSNLFMLQGSIASTSTTARCHTGSHSLHCEELGSNSKPMYNSLNILSCQIIWQREQVWKERLKSCWQNKDYRVNEHWHFPLLPPKMGLAEEEEMRETRKKES